FSSRTMMWNYSLDIIKDYKYHNYLIGDGFNYNSQYAKEFNNISGFTYPHNILISTFHYSGIIGVIIWLVIMSYPIIVYFKNQEKNSRTILYVYSLCLLFLLVSGNSFFSTNIMWLTITIIISTLSLKSRTIN